jgi:hypothetical protein
MVSNGSNWFKIWHDRKIVAGSDYAAEIDRQLNSSDVVTLLVSSDFLASNYCYDTEMGRALECAKKGQLMIDLLSCVHVTGRMHRSPASRLCRKAENPHNLEKQGRGLDRYPQISQRCDPPCPGEEAGKDQRRDYSRSPGVGSRTVGGRCSRSPIHLQTNCSCRGKQSDATSATDRGLAG